MLKAEAVEAISEVMKAYDENRAKWFDRYKTYAGFDAWFTLQCLTRNKGA